MVAGPGAIPRIADSDRARAWPELAVLSATAHGRDPECVDTIAVALDACDRLDSARSTLYADLIFAGMNHATRRALETLMEARRHEYQSRFARKYFGEGRREGQATLLRRQLTRRFGDLPADVRARIDAATEEELSRWGERILEAASLAEVFATPPE